MAVKEKEGHFLEGGFLGQVVDRIAAVSQAHPLFAYRADRGLTGDDAGQPTTLFVRAHCAHKLQFNHDWIIDSTDFAENVSLVRSHRAQSSGSARPRCLHTRANLKFCAPPAYTDASR